MWTPEWSRLFGIHPWQMQDLTPGEYTAGQQHINAATKGG